MITLNSPHLSRMLRAQLNSANRINIGSQTECFVSTPNSGSVPKQTRWSEYRENLKPITNQRHTLNRMSDPTDSNCTLLSQTNRSQERNFSSIMQSYSCIFIGVCRDDYLFKYTRIQCCRASCRQAKDVLIAVNFSYWALFLIEFLQ
jgi:hypothetical protein